MKYNRQILTHQKIDKFERIDDDVWDDNYLGLKCSLYGGEKKLHFSAIQQEWLKIDIKRFIKYKAGQTKSFRSLLVQLHHLKYFAGFLLKESTLDRIEDLDRSLVVRYFEYLSRKQLSQNTRRERISTVVSFLEIGKINNWFEVEPYLIRKGDLPQRTKVLPRYMPDDVIQQLNLHLESLPEPVMRMVLVIQECGLRIGELCQLPLDCLQQDGKGGWFIRFMRWKMNFETTLPISVELAQVIQEQQQYIHNEFGGKYEYLFGDLKRSKTTDCLSISRVMRGQKFVNYLKDLADNFDIRDSTGKRWNFQTHQFRHTVGTKMINNGVPQHIIQRYLGHESPQMTAVYAHIHDSTLRKAIDQYLGTKVVDINGEVIQSIAPELDNNSELQWLKKKVLAETLSNGYCGLPAQLTCSKGNACLTCSDFRTTIEYLDQHKQHLERTNQVLEVAQANGWERQIQVNQDVKNSLEKIIATLEGNRDV
jgi:integrase/recombinase XerD